MGRARASTTPRSVDGGPPGIGASDGMTDTMGIEEMGFDTDGESDDTFDGGDEGAGDELDVS